MREIIRQAIIETLYANEFTGQGETNLELIRLKGIWEQELFWHTVERIIQDALIQQGARSGYYRITSFGAVYAEDNGIAAGDLVAQNREIRMQTLDALAKMQEKEGYAVSGHYATLAKITGYEEQKILENLNLMRDIGLVDYGGGGAFLPTHQGLNAVKAWRVALSPSGELERIEGLKSGERQVALQELLGSLIDAEGWRVDEIIRLGFNESEVIYAKGREYYHLRCTWEIDPLDARDVHQFQKGLVNRVGVRGILFSMSGFSKESLSIAMDSAKQRLILFFGPKDIRSIIYGNNTFDALLGDKVHSAIKNGHITFE
jgi:hypothetical protein